ncbi:MAG: metallophosphoesterase [Candidatus Pacearchaeota archaeon]
MTETKEKKKIRILAAGDIHGDVELVNKLAKKADKYNVDIVILTGDITFGEMTAENLVGPFLRKDRKILLIPGNHESLATIDFLVDLYGPEVKNIHGYSFKMKDVGIFGAGGAIGVGPKFTLTESQIFSALKQGFKKIKDVKKKIMITHVHPAGSLAEKFSKIVPGSKAVEKAIKYFKPDFALFSHVHEASGLEEKIGKTKLINVGREGKIIEVEIED